MRKGGVQLWRRECVTCALECGVHTGPVGRRWAGRALRMKNRTRMAGAWARGRDGGWAAGWLGYGPRVEISPVL